MGGQSVPSVYTAQLPFSEDPEHRIRLLLKNRRVHRRQKSGYLRYPDWKMLKEWHTIVLGNRQQLFSAQLSDFQPAWIATAD